jgi:uncharacterized protein YbjQ (UPF0145 family)
MTKIFEITFAEYVGGRSYQEIAQVTAESHEQAVAKFEEFTENIGSDSMFEILAVCEF